MIYNFYLRLGFLELEHQRAEPLCPNFPKDKKSFQLLAKRYYKCLHYINRATEYFLEDNIKKCIKYINKTIRLNCRQNSIHLLLGFCFEKNKKYKKALTELKIAEKIYPKNLQINISLLNCYRKIGKIEELDGELLKIYYKLKNSNQRWLDKTDKLREEIASLNPEFP